METVKVVKFWQCYVNVGINFFSTSPQSNFLKRKATGFKSLRLNAGILLKQYKYAKYEASITDVFSVKFTNSSKNSYCE